MPLSVDAGWSGLAPADLLELLVDAPVWVAGGHALDLWLQFASRPHGDLDVGCMREDLPRLRSRLVGWFLFEAHDGALFPLAHGEPPRPDVNSLWAHREGHRHWDIQIMFDRRVEGRWTYRRDPAITVPESQLTWLTTDGIRVLRPEVQLLYKSADPRPKDDLDLSNVLPRLDTSARAWLADAIGRAHPGSPWIDRVRSSP
ncbi:MAG: amino acid transporter [Gemmatimonadota bacterium]